MTATEFDDRQNPDEQSPEHDLQDAHPEFGGGALQSPDDPRDYPVSAFMDLAAAIDFPPRFAVPNRPGIRNQGNTPQCVAYSSGYDQSHIDRPEAGKFFDPWEARFFAQIGGGPNGAYMRNALEQRRKYGYPVQNHPGLRQYHRIGAYYRVPLGLEQIKMALVTKPANGGVLVIGPWAHSWCHPLPSGKLPAWDYQLFGHAWWLAGWDDDLGLMGQQSWGPTFGKGGLFYLPYANISRLWEVWRTVDK